MSAPKLKGAYQLVAKVDINASKTEVWKVISDFANVYTWAPSVTASYSLTDEPTGLGAGRYCKLDGFGEIEEYITVWQEGEGFVYDVTPLGPLHQSFSSWWLNEIDPQTTKLTVVLAYEVRFGLFGKLMHKLVMRRKLEENFPNSLKALKHRIETGQLARPFTNSPAVA